MTREQFIEKFRHEFAGLALDGAMGGRSGKDLSMFARMVMMRVNERLGEIYDGFNKPAQKPVQQGQPEAKR